MTNADRRHPTDVEILHRIIDRQHAIIERLSVSPAFDCLTRPALDLLLENFDLEGTVAVFWDIDHLKQANERWGKDGSSARIKSAIRSRVTDCVAGQVFSGDEFIAFPPEADAVAMAERIMQRLHEQGMSATFYITFPHPGETPNELLKRVSAACDFFKDQNLRDQIHYGYGWESR